MSLKTYKPYTKSRRGTILVDKSGLWKGKPYKPLTLIKNASKKVKNFEWNKVAKRIMEFYEKTLQKSG